MIVIFLFFKQKTAYEMRISDWSSDVCSSDLDPRPVYRRFDIHAEIENVQRIGHTILDQRHARRSCRKHGLAVRTEDDVRRDKIGRASCRARGCQARLDLGGRRTLKKK